MKNIKSDALRAYVIFLPTLPPDDLESAKERASEFDDGRLIYFWDPERAAGNAWQSVFGFEKVAWDLYFLYAAGDAWKNGPSMPVVKMHGHSALGENFPQLNIQTLVSETERLLAGAEKKRR